MSRHSEITGKLRRAEATALVEKRLSSTKQQKE